MGGENKQIIQQNDCEGRIKMENYEDRYKQTQKNSHEKSIVGKNYEKVA